MPMERTLFSWSSDQLEQPEATARLLAKGNINAIFQHIRPADTDAAIQRFLSTIEQDVYFLSGDPQWALDPARLIETVKRANSFSPQIKGIVIDVEPYLLAEFKANPAKVMQQFIASMKLAYRAAKVKVILCLPFFLDEMGFTTELAQLIKEASDEVAIMNYYRGKEVPHIQTEARMSKQYAKPIYTIFELQPPDFKGIMPVNTYYHLGLKAVETQFQQMQRAYPGQALHLAFHEYRYFQMLLEKETNA